MRFSVLVALAAFLYASAADASPMEKRATLRDLAAAKGKYLGTAISAGRLSNSNYNNVGKNFGYVTPENELKWDATEGQRGVFTFSGADAVYNYAASTGAKVRGHTLIWYAQLPQWVQNIGDKNTLLSVMTNHINTVVGRYKGRTAQWDVVNEAFEENGSLRNDVYTRLLGEDAFVQAFKLAKAADPSALLFINDYNIEGINAKSTGLYNLVKRLKAAGAPIDGVGFQSHFRLGGVPGDFAANLKRFTDLGLKVALTELDVAIKSPASAANLQTQGQDYAKAIGVCLANANCLGVTIWGVDDGTGWIQPSNGGYGQALLWDANYNQKPAYTAVVKVLGG